MKNSYPFNLLSTVEILETLRDRVVRERIFKNYTAAEVAKRAGVAYSTYRHFEMKAKISLENLIKISQALDMQGHLEKLFVRDEVIDVSDLKKRNHLVNRKRVRTK